MKCDEEQHHRREQAEPLQDDSTMIATMTPKPIARFEHRAIRRRTCPGRRCNVKSAIADEPRQPLAPDDHLQQRPCRTTANIALITALNDLRCRRRASTKRVPEQRRSNDRHRLAASDSRAAASRSCAASTSSVIARPADDAEQDVASDQRIAPLPRHQPRPRHQRRGQKRRTYGSSAR